jgi:hypothetical protein
MGGDERSLVDPQLRLRVVRFRVPDDDRCHINAPTLTLAGGRQI